MENISQIFSIWASIAVIIASGFAVWGIFQWRKQVVYQRKLDVAEEARFLFSRVRDAFREIRSDIGLSSEGTSRPRKEDEKPEFTMKMDMLYVPIERLNNYGDLFSRIETLKHKFTIHFGENNETPFDEIKRIKNEINLAASKLINIEKGKYDANIKKREMIRKQSEGVIWEEDDYDEIKKRIEDSVEQIEKLCKPLFKN